MIGNEKSNKVMEVPAHTSLPTPRSRLPGPGPFPPPPSSKQSIKKQNILFQHMKSSSRHRKPDNV